jgi:hypothetical protein
MSDISLEEIENKISKYKLRGQKVAVLRRLVKDGAWVASTELASVAGSKNRNSFKGMMRATRNLARHFGYDLQRRYSYRLVRK